MIFQLLLIHLMIHVLYDNLYNTNKLVDNLYISYIFLYHLLLYLYFVYNVIFLPSKKLILCCYPCLVMLFMIKNLARKRNKPLQCVGLR